MKHIALPYPIDEENGSAKFDISKRQLTVTLPVLPATDIPQMVGMVIYLFSSAIECYGGSTYWSILGLVRKLYNTLTEIRKYVHPRNGP